LGPPGRRAGPPGAGPALKVKLFISYRPADLDHVERLHGGLVAAFGYDPVIRDPEAIPIPFAKRRAAYLEDWLRAASAVLVVIGPGWVDAIDARGRRRLRRKDDTVRMAVEAARRLGIPLVPVLVGGASMPGPETLPRSLRALCGRTAHPLRAGSGFAADLDGLAVSLARLEERPVRRVTQATHRQKEHRLGRWREARFRMSAEHAIRFDWTGFPATLRLILDGRVVWESKRNFRRFPNVDAPFRIESENADCWLVLRDRSTPIIYGLAVAVWVENTRVMWFRW
jgi:hypothetical protein